MVIPKTALLAGRVYLFNFEKEAFLFYLDWKSLSFVDLAATIDFLECSKFCINIDDVNLVIFMLE